METPASSIDLAMNMDQKYRVVGGVASEMGSLFFVFIRKATAFSEYRVQWPVEKERRGRCWRGKENRETAPWVVEIAWDPEHVWVSLLTSRKLTLQQSMCGLAFRQVENTLQQSTCGLAFRQVENTLQHPCRRRRWALKQIGLGVVIEFPIWWKLLFACLLFLVRFQAQSTAQSER